MTCTLKIFIDDHFFENTVCIKAPVLRIDNQQNFKIVKILILLKSFISLFYVIRYILRSMLWNLYTRDSFLGKIQVITKLEGKWISRLRYFLLSYNIAHTVHQVQLKWFNLICLDIFEYFTNVERQYMPEITCYIISKLLELQNSCSSKQSMAIYLISDSRLWEQTLYYLWIHWYILVLIFEVQSFQWGHTKCKILQLLCNNF